MSAWSAPVVGVSVIIFRDATAQEVLLVERGKNPLKGYWSPPGGRLELGETIAAAAEREVREECAITIHLPPRAAFTTLDRITYDNAENLLYHFVLVGVAAIAETGAIASAGDDAAACRWVRVHDLPAIHPKVEELAEIIELAKTRLG